MSARDELLRAVRGTRHMHALHLQVPADIVEHVAEGITDAILAAGYSKPRTIETVEELDALPAGAVVRCKLGIPHEKQSDGEGGTDWKIPDSTESLQAYQIALPATVLHEPAA